MSITANDINRKSWLEVSSTSDFPIQNIPFGVFLTKENIVTVGTRIGDFAIDLGALQQLNYFEGIELTDDMFMQDTLNDFISDGEKTWRLVRNRIADIFDEKNSKLRDNAKDKDIIIFRMEDVEMQLPVLIGDYTDFYSSKEHATNVGKMFRDPENALLPNWLHIPVGYHGRSSTIVPSGIPVHRPMGQMLPNGETSPVFGSSRSVDFELETAFITTDVNIMGENILITEADEYIFGMVLLNDWSARDIQKWEYVPLGPFNAKTFASEVSPWIVTMDALAPFKTACPTQEPKPLAYLNEKDSNNSFDINLSVELLPENSDEATVVCETNFKYMYWSMAQQLTHHTITGCKVEVGDMMGSGTISGPTPDSYGSMLEIAWNATKPVTLKGGETRSFIEDGDTVIMKGYSEKDGIRVGFGEVRGKVLPALSFDFDK